MKANTRRVFHRSSFCRQVWRTGATGALGQLGQLEPSRGNLKGLAANCTNSTIKEQFADSRTRSVISFEVGLAVTGESWV